MASKLDLALRGYLKNNNEEKKTKASGIPTSLRIPESLKSFYSALSLHEGRSLNATYISALELVKESTIEAYRKNESDYLAKVISAQDMSINMIFKIFDIHKIGHKDIPTLLSYFSNKKVSDMSLRDHESLVSILDKTTMLRICKTFGFNYDWLGRDNEQISHKIGFGDTFYREIKNLIEKIIYDYHIQDNVISMRLDFIISDPENYLQDFNLVHKRNESIGGFITPFLIVERMINGVATRTFHKMKDQESAAYHKVRKSFADLSRHIEYFFDLGVLCAPNVYHFEPGLYDDVRSGKIHLSEIINYKSMPIAWDWLDIAELSEAKPNICDYLDLRAISKIKDLIQKKNTSLDVIKIDEAILDGINAMFEYRAIDHNFVFNSCQSLAKYLRFLSEIDITKEQIDSSRNAIKHTDRVETTLDSIAYFKKYAIVTP
tara:strand:- start:20677 stop:21975 length:1299 start_codon:yes stop_codon:yes gene_type:complete